MTAKKKNTQKHMKRKSPRKKTRRRTSRKNNRKFQKWQLALIAIGVLLIAGVTGLHLYSHPTQIGSGKYTHAAKFDNALIIDGIDVSYAQGDGASHNWNHVKRSGVDFVFIRAGYRDSSKGKLHADSEFKENIQGARKAGLMVGIYFYSQATTKKEAREEARKLVNAADGYQIDLPLVMDYELYPKGRLEKFMNGKKYKAAKGTEIAEAFCQVVREAGYEPSVYSNYNLLMHKVNPKKVAGFARVWLAHYNSSTDYPHNYTFWQASFEEKVHGISGTVDRNFWYFGPNGEATRGRRAAGARSIRDCTVQLEKHSFYYIGKPIQPKLIVKDGNTKLREGTDYQVGYVKNASAGTGYAIVTGIGKYKDRISTGFRIKTLL